MQTMLRLAEEERMKEAFCVGEYPCGFLFVKTRLWIEQMSYFSFYSSHVLSNNNSYHLLSAYHMEGPLQGIVSQSSQEFCKVSTISLFYR